MDTILAVGAQGECPAELIALLQAAGFGVPFSTPDDRLTADAMAAVKHAQQELGVDEPTELNVKLTDGTPVVVKGALASQATWDALRVAAARRTGLVTMAEALALKEPTNAVPASDLPPAAGVEPAGDEAEQAGTVEEAPEGVTPGEKAAQAAAAAAAAGGSAEEVAAAAAGVGASPDQATAGEKAAATP